jgi:hypothetical protein
MAQASAALSGATTTSFSLRGTSNSSHGRGAHLATIAADLWICQIAGLGFEVEKLVMVRESAVVLRKRP